MDTTTTENVGIEIQISKKGLKYAAEQAIKLLIARSLRTKIKDNVYSGKALGAEVKYGVSDMELVSFPLPETVVESQPLVWKVAGISASLKGQYYYKVSGLIKLKDHGSFNVNVKNWSLQVQFELGRDQDGRPTVKAMKSECSKGDCDIEIRSKAPWFYNMFKATAENYVGTELKNLLERESLRAVNESCAKKLNSWTIKTRLYDDLFLDSSLAKEPTMIKECLVSHHKGQVFCSSVSCLERPAVTCLKPELDYEKDKMVTFHFALERTLNALAYLEFARDKLEFTVGLEDVAKFFFQSKTEESQGAGFSSTFQMSFPKIRVAFTRAPEVVCKGKTMQITCNISVIAVETNYVLLTTVLSLSAQISFSVEEMRIMPDISNMCLEHITIESEVFGDSLDEVEVKKFIETQLQTKGVTKLQQKLRAGIELPKLDKISLFNTEILLRDGVLTVETDIRNNEE